MAREERVREDIAKIEVSLDRLGLNFDSHTLHIGLHYAHQILLTKVYGEVTIRDLVERGVLKADGQSLPEPRMLGGIPSQSIGLSRETQQDMLTPKDGTVWVKCLERKGK